MDIGSPEIGADPQHLPEFNEGLGRLAVVGQLRIPSVAYITYKDPTAIKGQLGLVFRKRLSVFVNGRAAGQKPLQLEFYREFEFQRPEQLFSLPDKLPAYSVSVCQGYPVFFNF